MGYQDYITFDQYNGVQAYIEANGAKGTVGEAPQFLKDKMDSALTELYSTPEGRDLIENAAKATGGKISLSMNMSGSSVALLETSTILIGTDIAGANYYSPETDGYHPITVQRVLAHELEHLSEKHQLEQNREAYAHREALTINKTNAIMSKYYGEPERTEDHSHPATYSTSSDPTELFALNDNFSGPEGHKVNILDSGFSSRLMNHLSGISSEEAISLQPETQALRLATGSIERFEMLLDEYTQDSEAFAHLLQDLPESVMNAPNAEPIIIPEPEPEPISFDAAFSARLLTHLTALSNEDAQNLQPETQALRTAVTSYEQFNQLLEQYQGDEEALEHITSDLPDSVKYGTEAHAPNTTPIPHQHQGDVGHDTYTP